MGRSPSTFRQTDITRALRAIRAAGFNAVRVLIGKDGRIEIATMAEGKVGTPCDAQSDTDLDRELKDWERRRGR
jgi:hypothetical protein